MFSKEWVHRWELPGKHLPPIERETARTLQSPQPRFGRTDGFKTKFGATSRILSTNITNF